VEVAAALVAASEADTAVAAVQVAASVAADALVAAVMVAASEADAADADKKPSYFNKNHTLT
jgi:hypothetical protein